MSRRRHLIAALTFGLALTGGAARSARATGPEVDVVEHLGASLPLELPFVDSTGRTVRLVEAFQDKKPVLLVLAYYRCPVLCGLVLGAAARVIATLDWRVGTQFRVLTVSFDETDDPSTATRRRQATFDAHPALASRLAAENWPFWVGDRASIAELLDALGVTVRRDPKTRQLAHPAVTFALTPDGRISRYLYGVDVPPKDVKLALLEASNGRTGSTFERVLLRCYAYDPATRRYGLFIRRYFQAGGAVLLSVTGLGLFVLFRRDRARGVSP